MSTSTLRRRVALAIVCIAVAIGNAWMTPSTAAESSSSMPGAQGQPRPEFSVPPPRLEPAYPETKAEIAEAREHIVAEYYDQIGNPQDEEPTRISSLEELAEYARKDDVHVKMEPGTYHITKDNFTDILSQFQEVRRNADPHVGNDTWKDPVNLINFAGCRSYYDLRDVTITYETRLLHSYGEVLNTRLDARGWGGRVGIEVILVTGDQSIIRGLNVEPVHKPDKWDTPTHPSRSARTLTLWEPHRTMLQDVSVVSKGSFPYGYGRMLGKGGSGKVETIRKHSAVQWGGRNNCIVGVDVQSRSYGHVSTVSPYRFIFIDTTLSGQLRRSDDMLREETGVLVDLDYKTKYGKLTPGIMVSLQEAGMRTYHVIQEESKVLNCSIAKTDGAQGLVNSKVGWFMSNCSTLKNAGKGFSPPSNSRLVNCRADIRYSPALQLGGKYATDGDPENVEVHLEILPSPTEGIQRQYPHYACGAKRKFQAAFIAGDGHDITLRQTADDLQLSEPRPIIIGSFWFSRGGAKNVTLENRTKLPVILRESTRNCTVRTGTHTKVIDRGQGNEIIRIETGH